TVIQTGAIAAVAFVFGEYATQLVPLGANSAAWWAAIGVVLLPALTVAGTLQSKSLQSILELALVASLVAIAIGGLTMGGAARPASGPSSGSFSLALIFVLYNLRGCETARELR